MTETKILTSADKWFREGFSVESWEAALEHYVKQGWTVKSIDEVPPAQRRVADREEFTAVLQRPTVKE